MQVMSGGVHGRVTVWEISHQKLVARQHISTGSYAIGEAHPLLPLSYTDTAWLFR